jgi:predicted dehydrogenase
MAGFTVIGEHGMLSVTQGSTGYLKVLGDGPADDDVSYSPEVHGRLHGAMGIEADHFVRCVRSETAPICTAADGTEAVRVALGMEEAADSGQVVTL